MIGMRSRAAARSRSMSGGPTQTRAERPRPPDVSPSRTAEASPPARSSRASTGTSAGAPSTTIGRTRTRPPLPRAARTIARGAGAERLFLATAATPPAHVDSLEDPDRDKVRDHRRASDRHERERDAGDRSDADRHPDVDVDLEQEGE